MTGGLIAGTFYAWDRLPVLFEFVRESLVDGWQPFELIAPGSQKLSDSGDVALAECNLVSLTHVKAPAASVSGFLECVCTFAQVPAALLTFAWDAAVQADIAAAGGKSPSLLKPELLENLQTLS